NVARSRLPVSGDQSILMVDLSSWGSSSREGSYPRPRSLEIPWMLEETPLRSRPADRLTPHLVTVHESRVTSAQMASSREVAQQILRSIRAKRAWARARVPSEEGQRPPLHTPPA